MRGRGFLNLLIFLISLASSNPDTSVTDQNGNRVDSPLETTRSTVDTDGGTTVLGPVSLANSMPTEPVTALSVFVQNKDTSTLLGANVSETQEASMAVQVIVPLSTPVANIMVKSSSSPTTALQEGSPKSNGDAGPVTEIYTREYKDLRADSKDAALLTTVTATSASVRAVPDRKQDDLKPTKAVTPMGPELTSEGHEFLGDDPMLAVSTKTSLVPSSSPMPFTTVPAVGTLRFEPRDHEPRIYGAAPSGVLVTRVVAMDTRYPNTAPVYRLMGAEESSRGPRPSHLVDDSQYFQIHGLSGNITTRRYIDRPIGSTYHIAVVATSRGGSEVLPLSITVTEYNSFPPRFERTNYTVQLDVLTPIGATIVTVSAKDKDPQKYNSEVYYRLHRDNNIVSINKLTGVVTLRKPLRAFFSELQITILAHDGGSPQRTGRTKLIIIVKLISAPREVEVLDTGYRWAMICWKAPHSGNPDGYIMVLQQNETITTRNITMQELGRDEDYFCLAVDNLKQRSNYVLHIAGWNNQEVGIISAGVRLTTMVNQTCSLVNGLKNKLDYFCSCLPGYYGEKCTLFNPCNSTESPCLNGGICRSNASEMFTCECLEGYYGATCQHFNPCSRSPCQHNSTCMNITSSNYKCFCTHGYTGHLCEVNIDECESQPCQNEGVCIDALNSFSCKCASGYEGEYCELNINECISDPCQNGATCEDVTGKYLCKCPTGYEGKNCEVNIDDCLSNPCENNGTCVDGIEDYFCNCQAGFEGDYCEDEVNECMARPCLHGGSCTDAFNDFSCECPAGYSGKRCEWDVDLCQSNPCQNGGECVDLVDHFKCKCPLGYQGDNCETKVKCPAETLKTERGLFSWEPVEHGAVARIPCPYGIDKNYVAYTAPQFYHQSSTSGDSRSALDESSLQTHTFIWWGEQKRENSSELQYSQDNEQAYKSSGTFKVQTYLKNSEHERSVDLTSMKKQQKEWQIEEKNYTLDDKGNVYAIRRCVQDADGTVRWGRLFDDVCRDEGSMNAERWSQHLEHITRNPSQINIELLINISRHIQKIVTYALRDTKIAESLFTVISNIMDVNESVLYEGDKDGLIAQSIVQAVEDYAHTVKLEEVSKLVIASENLVLAVLKINSNEREIAEGLSFSPPEVQNAETSHLSEAGNMQHVFRETQNIFINIPGEALLKATKYTRSLRVKFISYKNGKLFMPNSNRSRTFQGPQMVSTQQHVITAAISNVTIENLTDTIVYQLPNLHGQAKQICAFWDSENREWSEYGITTNQTTEWILCESTHMTSFSVLLDPTLTWETSEIPYKHKVILSIVSYVGSICSIIGLLLTIITYSLFRCLSRDRSGKILLNLCVSLLLMNIAFILMSMKEVFSKDTTKTTEICTALAIVTHYLVLSSLTWMLVEAMHMYQLLITVFATGETRFMCKRMLLAWGIPLLIVAGTSIYDIQYYTSPSPECTVSPSQTVLYYVTYIAPSSFILIINFIVFILVTRVLFQQRGHSHGMGTYGVRTESSITLSQVRGAFTVMTLLGVTWVFGALALGEAKLVLQYLFCLTNSLQGFIIFIVRCIQYPDAWNAWTTLFLTGQLKKHRGAHGTTGLPSSSSGNTFSRPTFSSHTLPQDVSKVI